ncbi:hypothetical protein ABES03_10240 [Neobacillus rhizosphaerae]|uniref:hypothetical protein n=1 Tax=Neobacillus rhizosphaerae TaxID=2880965 RepID=UPI003D2E3765
MEGKEETYLILDVNMLYDLYKSDKALIPLISSSVGQIHLASSGLEQIKFINKSDCYSLGIHIIEPNVKHLFDAMTRRGTLSFQDHLCLILAKENGWTCVTNCNPLRRECEIENIPFIWRNDIIRKIALSGAITAVTEKKLLNQLARFNPIMYRT